MREGMSTGDVIIGLIAGFGVIVMIIVFFLVVKHVLLKKENDPD